MSEVLNNKGNEQDHRHRLSHMSEVLNNKGNEQDHWPMSVILLISFVVQYFRHM
jgi:hypothetical protein